MFMSDPSHPAVQSGRAGECHKSATQQRRDGETVRLTNQTRSTAGQEGQDASQIKTTPSAGWRLEQITPTPSHLPLVRVEGEKKDAQWLLTLKRQNGRRNE